MSGTHPLTLSWDDGLDGGEAALTDVGEVRRRITALDGAYRTLVTIGAGGEAHLACGGDSRTGLVLYLTADNRVFHQLIDDAAAASEEVPIFAGQQEGWVSARYVVSLELAVAAAEYYAIHAEPSPALTWETYRPAENCGAATRPSRLR